MIKKQTYPRKANAFVLSGPCSLQFFIADFKQRHIFTNVSLLFMNLLTVNQRKKIMRLAKENLDKH